jgi:hypothetical protein
MFLSTLLQQLLQQRLKSKRWAGEHPEFHLQMVTKQCGAEGIRTPDLRRAKAAQYIARGFWSLQNTCKLPYLLGGALLKVSGVLLRLLHGCYTRVALQRRALHMH